jgi:hypothetical protein
MEATPAAAPPMAVRAATPVAMDFTDFTGPPSMHMDRGGILRIAAHGHTSPWLKMV